MSLKEIVQRRIARFFMPTPSLPVLFDTSELSADILEKILLRVDLETLIRAGPCVSPLWYDILKQKSFWVERARLDGADPSCFPPSSITDVPFDLGKIYYYKPFNRNLIENHSGQHGFEGWKVVNRGYSDRMKVENPPVMGNSLAHPSLDVPCCFVTSYSLSEKTIIIDFAEFGVDPEIMDRRPHIAVSEWCSHRNDCAAEYTLEVCLLDENSEEFDDEDTVFQFHRHMRQWDDLEWQEASHVFTNYPRGVRKVMMTSSGQDCQFWKGHYGSKMAHASVKLQYEFDGPVEEVE
uniref:FBA domain-containing protein n=1 Tax=Steinernema glaseri TaxID=37863 RepID=A0A1I7Z345_9BILA